MLLHEAPDLQRLLEEQAQALEYRPNGVPPSQMQVKALTQDQIRNLELNQPARDEVNRCRTP
jgi:hypothetical protein